MRTLNEIQKELHDKYDDDMYCPKCGRLLTGLHMESRCYVGFIAKTAARIKRQEQLVEARELKLKEQENGTN